MTAITTNLANCLSESSIGKILYLVARAEKTLMEIDLEPRMLTNEDKTALIRQVWIVQANIQLAALEVDRLYRAITADDPEQGGLR